MELPSRIGHTFLRKLKEEDLDELERIHEKYYKSEFSLYSFFDNHRSALLVGDDEGIITVGVLHPILEVGAITNKDRPAWLRREALIEMNEMYKVIAKEMGYDEIYAFIQDPKWYKVIQRYGYRPAKGRAVLTEVRHGKQ